MNVLGKSIGANFDPATSRHCSSGISTNSSRGTPGDACDPRCRRPRSSTSKIQRVQNGVATASRKAGTVRNTFCATLGVVDPNLQNEAGDGRKDPAEVVPHVRPLDPSTQ